MVSRVIYISSIITTFLCLNLQLAFGQCAKFEPTNEKVLLIMGQDLGATGGFGSPSNDGYVDRVGGGFPAGVTTYTSLPSLNGLESIQDYGAGLVCGTCYLENESFDNSFIAMGLYMVNHLSRVASGQYDTQIERLAQWVIDADRPIFLRIGYEFEFQYTEESTADYIAAYRHIVDKFREMGVTNCAYVWQAAGGTASWNSLSRWYPGDSYVDWFGYSHFQNNGSTMIAQARAKGKPIMIAESTPYGWKLDEAPGNFAWNVWFKPMFDHIEANKDVIKALAYINQDWDTQWLWNGQGWGNSRIQDNADVQELWEQQMNSGRFVMASPTLFESLSQCKPVATSPAEDLTPIEIFPNPTEGRVVVSHGSLRWVQVYNISGQLLFPEVPAEGTSLELDMSSLDPGVYTLRIQLGDTILSQKLLKL